MVLGLRSWHGASFLYHESMSARHRVHASVAGCECIGGMTDIPCVDIPHGGPLKTTRGFRGRKNVKKTFMGSLVALMVMGLFGSAVGAFAADAPKAGATDEHAGMQATGSTMTPPASTAPAAKKK